jgi:hypothetical protein
MKTFKQYIKVKKQVKFLDAHSFTELREKKKPVKFLDTHSFAELRSSNKKVNETTDYSFLDPESKPLGYSKLHDDAEVKPLGLTKEHSDALKNYTSTRYYNPKSGHASSANMNEYLRNRAGISGVHSVLYHQPEVVEASVKKLASAFTPANTNKKEVTGYGAVPSSVGETLEKSNKGDIHHFAGFTSLSASHNEEDAKRIAKDFARRYQNAIPGENGKDRHIIKYHLKPGTGISAVKHTEYDHENEMVLPYGAKVEYSHTEVEQPNQILRKVPALRIHHVIVHPDSMPLEQYGKYV